jgi:hypothetical protein
LQERRHTIRAWRSPTRWAALAVAIVLAAGAGVAIGAAVVEPDPSTGVSRIEQTVAKRWKAAFVGRQPTRSSRTASPVCAGAIPFRTRFVTPAAHESIDMTMTATLEYRTSRGDGLSVEGILYDVAANEFVSLNAPEYRLAPSRRTTTATLQWVDDAVPAGGREYSVSLLVQADCRVLNKSFAAGNKTTVVIESWSAGN